MEKEQHLEPIPAVNTNTAVHDAKHQINDIANSKSDNSFTEETQVSYK